MGPGLEELDKAHLFASALGEQARWNNRAALATALAVFGQVVSASLGLV